MSAELHPLPPATPSTSARLALARPLVSVIIPARNARATIARALSSVAAQDYAPLEVILVDDGSVDHVHQIAEEFPGLKIQLKRLDAPVGVAEARNRGLALASGEFVAFLDADDEWLPDKISRQVRVLKENPDLGVAYTDVLLVTRGTVKVYSETVGAQAQGGDAWKALLASPCVVASSVMVRRKLISDAGGFDPTYVVAEDQDLWIRLSLRGYFHFEAAPLVRKYQTRRSLSNVHRDLASTVTLPMIESYVSRLHQRLTPKELREILGHRRATAGRNAYETGSRLRGAGLILSAALSGNRPLRNLSYLISASPLGGFIKRLFPPSMDPLNGRARSLDLDLDRPLFSVIVDASGDASEATPRQLDKLVSLCDRFGVCPTISVDERFLANNSAVRVLARHVRNRTVEPGVYLPRQEGSATRSGYAEEQLSDVGYAQEFETLSGLTEAVSRRLGQRPLVHKTNKPGPSAARALALSALGYETDVSVGWRFVGARDAGIGLDEDTQLLSMPPFCEFDGRPHESRHDLIQSRLMRGHKVISIGAKLTVVGQRSVESQEFERTLALLVQEAKARAVAPRYLRDLLSHRYAPFVSWRELAAAEGAAAQ